MAYCIWKQYKLDIPLLDIFEAVSKKTMPFFLDSSLNSNYSLGRFSFLGFDPFYVFQQTRGDPFDKIRLKLGEFKIKKIAGIPFTGGAVGYLTYDLGLILEEKLKKRYNFQPDIPDCLFAFYNKLIIVDHLKKVFYLFSLGFPEKKGYLAKVLAADNFKDLCRFVANIKKTRGCLGAIQQNPRSLRLESNFSKEGYIHAVRAVKDYIKKGDIYQLNLSQQFQGNTDLSSVDIYKRLRNLSPSFFSAYFDAGDFQIISSSPERFLKIEDSLVLTRPMKGTRRRGKYRKEDTALKRGLLDSLKDKAELMMIVDLERNDLGRACSYKTIRVRQLRELEKYSTVFQTTATIEGRLANDRDRFDLLRACFPGGSITGCPKIRAMEIINELEKIKRSIYTGSLGYLSFSGDMDFNIMIRTILKKGGRINFGVGGGIVADSSPEKEYLETLIKAKAMFKAVS